MAVVATIDPHVQNLLFESPGQTKFVEALIELVVTTNPLEIDVEVPEPLVSAEIPEEFSVTVDVDTNFQVTLDQSEENVILEVIEFPVIIEECDT